MQLRPLFILALAIWAGAFVVLSRWGTWAPLGVLGPLAAALVLATDRQARALLVPTPRLLLFGLAGAVIMVGGTYLSYALLARVAPELPLLTAALYRDLRAANFTSAERAALIPLVAAAEEIVFRGVALPDGGKRAPMAVALNALIVGAAHLASGSWLLALVATLAGALWGAMRTATRSCVPSVITHVLWDLTILVFRPLI